MTEGPDPAGPTPEPSRRDLLRLTSAGLTAVPLLGGAWALANVAGSPSPTEAPAQVDLCRLSEVPEDGSFVIRQVRFEVRRGPVRETEGATVLVARDEDEDAGVLALSARCPHLGCTVKMETADDQPPIVCPCHTARFDKKGNAVSKNPTSQSLRKLQVVVPESDDALIQLVL